MKTRVLLSILLVWTVTSECFAQCSNGGVAQIDTGNPVKADDPPVLNEIVNIEPPAALMTTNIAFIVDTSGSMNSYGRVGMAVTFANNIIGRPGDQLMIALFSFKQTHTRWPGLTDKEKAAAQAAGMLDGLDVKLPPKGWTYFPGKLQLESAQKWLNSRGANGGTNPVTALTEALAENVDDLSIVLITDGEDFDIPVFKIAVVIGQALRVGRGLKSAVIFVIGIGAPAANQHHLRDVGKEGGGGMYVVRRLPPPPLRLEENRSDLDKMREDLLKFLDND